MSSFPCLMVMESSSRQHHRTDDFGGFELRREEKILGFRADDLGVLC